MSPNLNLLSPEQLGKLFPIIIEEYNPQWPAFFEAEKKSILNTIKEPCILKISHIGSTAIPHIWAKPTIDILIEVNENFDKETFIASFLKSGYHYLPRPENPAPYILLAKGYTAKGFKGQAFHVHVRYQGNWDEIYFRDYLIANPNLAKEYEKLKMELAKKHKYNREDYTEAKTEFIQRVMKNARKKR